MLAVNRARTGTNVWSYTPDELVARLHTRVRNNVARLRDGIQLDDMQLLWLVQKGIAIYRGGKRGKWVVDPVILVAFNKVFPPIVRRS